MALAMGVLPAAAPAATADGPSPAVSYLDVASQPGNTRWLRSAAPTGASPVALTPSSYYTYCYDVSADGNVLIVGVKTAASATSYFDHTYGLVLVRRDGGTVTSRVLTNGWDSNPVISADGATVWWITGGRTWKHTAGVTSVVTATLFAPRAGEEIADFAVSPDGTKGAVTYAPESSGTSHLRVLAASFTGGRTAPYFETELTADPTYSNLVWMDDSSLLYGYSNPGESTMRTGGGTLVAGGAGGTAPPGDLTDLYDLRALSGEWWVWRDTGTVTEFARVADLADASAATFTARSNGDTTRYYVPSTTAPPALTSATNRATTYPGLVLSAAAATYGKRVVYSAYAEYLHALPGEALSRDANEVLRGMLQSSINGSTWSNVGWTSWARPVPWPGDPGYYGNAYSPVLTRNTWFRWVFPGDYLTKASTSPVRKVVVTPKITVKVAKKGAKRVVSGTVTRVGGKVYLYKGSRKVATATMSTRGAFTFKARALAHGTYILKVRADASWGAASKKFKV